LQNYFTAAALIYDNDFYNGSRKDFKMFIFLRFWNCNQSSNWR